MPGKHQIVFYPVGNGDTSQIALSQGRRVLFDFCHGKNAESADTPEIDLKKRPKEVSRSTRATRNEATFTAHSQQGPK